MNQNRPVLEASDLTRSFGHVQALRHGELRVHEGEIVAVVGDNGAGKSTLISCISGAVLPDTGEVKVDGRAVAPGSIQAAMEAGIATVYQDLAMAPDLSVAENIFLSNELPRPGLLGRLGILDRRAMRERAEQLMGELGITTLQDVTASVGELSGGQRQVVAVARAVSRASRLVIMDEPTAALGTRQSEIVLNTIEATRRRGLGVVLISHDLPRVLEIADRVVVMRLGRVTADVSPAGLRVSEIVALMLGEQSAVPEESLPS
jgi:ABC-type sugar transport system ATPase subunit